MMLKGGNTIYLDVSVVLNITGKINRFPLKTEKAEFLNKLGHEMLADSLPHHVESSTIAMLIGNDCYFNWLEPQKLDMGGGLSYLILSLAGF